MHRWLDIYHYSQNLAIEGLLILFYLFYGYNCYQLYFTLTISINIFYTCSNLFFEFNNSNPSWKIEILLSKHLNYPLVLFEISREFYTFFLGLYMKLTFYIKRWRRIANFWDLIFSRGNFASKQIINLLVHKNFPR